LRVLEALGPAGIFLAGPPRDEWKSDPYTVIADAEDDAGPLGGIVSALRRSSSPLLIALAVDLPNTTSVYLQSLLELCRDDCGVVPRREQYEPLVAIYPARSLALAQQLLAARSYSLQQFACECIAAGMAIEHRVSPAESAIFLNLNTPAELAAVIE
jgi:molybdopterin-guanine dinucleotide biosynthesis protein A